MNMKQISKEPIDILVTIDQNYIKPLEVMLYSLRLNNPLNRFRVWLLHKKIPTASIDNLQTFANKIRIDLNLLTMDNDFHFPAALLNLHDYPQEMYFRLLAGKILPSHLHRIIYLDPDILVINSIDGLWQLDLQGKMFAAAAHKGLTDIVSSINNIRLGTTSSYFNSGIMLMDLDKMRKLVYPKDISQAIIEHKDILILPDQDILNYLYGDNILQIDETKWNYDTRFYSVYLAKSTGNHNLEWVMQNTSILHFCGKPKPWQKKNSSRFKSLYLNYQEIVHRLIIS